MSRIIFYQPLFIDRKTDPNSGSIVRPAAMKKAFRELGYDVCDVSGSTKERTEAIKQALQDDIDFMYIESANIPMSLSNRNHWPIAPFADLRNIRKVSKKVKVGMFYRDAYWRFPTFSQEVGFLKSLLLKTLFRLEFRALKKKLDYIFVPNMAFAEFLPKVKGKAQFLPLPGGCLETSENKFSEVKTDLNLLYSGNLSLNEYDISGLLRVLQKSEHVNLCVNTNQKAYDRCAPEWPEIDPLLQSGRLTVQFSSYNETDRVQPEYNAAIIYNNIPDSVIPIYMPLKLFQYMAMGLPIIAKKGSGYGQFIEEQGIGWTFQDDADLAELLKKLASQPEEVRAKAENVLRVREKHTWKERAREVERTLG